MLHATLTDLCGDIVECDELDLLEVLLALELLTARCNFLCLTVGFHRDEHITSLRNTVEAEDLYRCRWRCNFDAMSTLIEHGANTARMNTSDEWIAKAQCTLLHKYGCLSTTAFIDLSLDDNTAC